MTKEFAHHFTKTSTEILNLNRPDKSGYFSALDSPPKSHLKTSLTKKVTIMNSKIINMLKRCVNGTHVK